MSDVPDNDEPERDEPAIVAERRQKLARLREAGVDPFPHAFERRTEIAAVRAEHESLADGQETESSYRVAGRIAANRDMGKSAFLDLVDRSGRIQLQSRANDDGARHSDLMALDLGDIVGVEGTIFKSRRGELTLRISSWTLLAKSVLPPPDKWKGLGDVDTRFRHRERDLIANADVRERFALRSRIVSGVRRWLDSEGFLEVETPVLQPIYGGALARPFQTHHNELDRNLYLRIATELYLKRLIVGGLERVYELGKDFRNEGVSFKHNPEFTMVEWYEAYADYSDEAKRLEEMVAAIARDVLGTTVVERDGHKIELAPPWKRVTIRDAIRDETGIDILEHSTREALAEAMGIEPKPEDGWGKLVDDLLSKRVEPGLIQPTFIMDYPVEMSPFAKRHRTDEGLVERWEAYVGGFEIANAFTELNDPDEQRRRFLQQAEELARGDAEAQPMDVNYIEALEAGMPPTGGVGLGIDRLVMLLTGTKSLREVVLFPAMRD